MGISGTLYHLPALPKSKINTEITQPSRQREGRKAPAGKKRDGSRGQSRISGDTRESATLAANMAQGLSHGAGEAR